ncbi:ankyrin repeat-containing domain protein, partial [Ilyonectria sp. MPI-CAGE-AT-0026]
DEDGRTALHRAADRGHEAVVRVLLEKGADVTIKDKKGRTAQVAPLHCTAINGHQGVVSSLVELEAAIDVLDASGNMPLLWAVYKGYEDVVGYLWPDANKKLRDHDGMTALHLAAAAGKVNVVMLLVEAG